MKTIDVKLSGKTITIPYNEGQTISEILRRDGLLLPSPCGGKGTCGKCKVTIVDANCNKKDVLACQHIPAPGVCIELNSHQYLSDKIVDQDTCTSTTSSQQGNFSYGIAVDLGTTTVVVTLADLDTKIPVTTIKEWNQQISFGSDVISRVDYCMKNPDHLSELSAMIQTQIRTMIDEMCNELDIPFSTIKHMTVSGNTIMEHLFTGIDPTP
ncbi:MAG: 2Fe-2S iron-sulfur cluster-binding protein, partial [Lachnospiraceae bacterium]|nr:2Fe-2S iron-sulfur cluster-binding protein [Lachnospiraceae bacterium]